MRLTPLLPLLQRHFPEQNFDTVRDIHFNDFASDTRLCKKNDVLIVDEHNKTHLKTLPIQRCAALLSSVPLPPQSIPVAQIIFNNEQLHQLLMDFYHIQTLNARMIGITGTNGKTSSSYFLAQILTSMGYKVGLLGTLGVGVYQSQKDNLTPSPLTTLDPIRLYQNIQKLESENVDFMILEVSSHGLAQQRIGTLKFDVVSFTNLSHDHLDYHITLEAYFEQKLKLFSKHTHATSNYSINLDDPHGKIIVEKLRTKTNSNHWYTYGLSETPPPHIKATAVTYLLDGIELTLSMGNQQHTIKAPLFGKINLYNLLCATSIAYALSKNNEKIIKAIKHLSSPTGRMQQLPKHKTFAHVMVDYAHTPDALKQVLKSLKTHQKSDAKLWCIFGCGGNRDQSKRSVMGAIAEKYADRIIITDDNPRHENANHIRSQIISGIQNKHKMEQIADRQEAIKMALTYADKQDWVLIAGKGHETYQIIGDQSLPFDDCQVAKNLMDSPCLHP